MIDVTTDFLARAKKLHPADHVQVPAGVMVHVLTRLEDLAPLERYRQRVATMMPVSGEGDATATYRQCLGCQCTVREQHLSLHGMCRTCAEVKG